MNLWQLLPQSLFESLMLIEGILGLPYLSGMIYLYLFYALFKYSEKRISLALFIALSLLSSTVMILSLGSGIGKIIPPLLLLAVVFMPLVMLIGSWFKKSHHGIKIWSISFIAGLTHSMAWVIWLFALSHS